VRRRVPSDERRQRVTDTIKHSEELLGSSELEVIYPYYDCTEVGEKLVPDICFSSEYHDSWKPVVAGAVV